MAESENLAHQTVLAQEAVAALFAPALARAAAPVYVDATFGGGGHSRRILSRLPPRGRLLALDCDEAAAARAARMPPENFRFFRRNYSELAAALREGAAGDVCGVLFDLGVSSLQLDDAGRGFSFAADAPLDMRLDRRRGLAAAQWLAQSGEEDIRRALRQFGEEPEARRVARSLFARRAEISTTGQLAAAVRDAKRQPTPGRHPATRTFQAIRIAVNDELAHLQKGLEAARDALITGGRLVVIAFHSLEDRIVKRLGAAATLPGIGRVGGSNLRAEGRMRRPSAAEVAANPRARSACMRVFTKMAEAA